MKHRLKERRNELLSLKKSSRDSQAPVELDQTRMGRLSRMDAMQMQAMAQATAGRRAQEVQRIEQALKRIDEGDYGYCVGCDELIPAKRLELDPAIPTCVACAA